MAIYIDDEFDATTLAELEQQVLERAREAWKRHVADEALYTYRRLAIQEGLIEEPKPGLFDLVSPHLQELWEKELKKEVSKRWPAFKIHRPRCQTENKKGDLEMSHETPTVTPIYTAEDLYGLLSRQESVNLDRLAATLAHSLQTSALVVDWVNRQILKEMAEQQAQAQAAKDQEAGTQESATGDKGKTKSAGKQKAEG